MKWTHTIPSNVFVTQGRIRLCYGISYQSEKIIISKIHKGADKYPNIKKAKKYFEGMKTYAWMRSMNYFIGMRHKNKTSLLDKTGEDVGNAECEVCSDDYRNGKSEKVYNAYKWRLV